MEEVKPYTEVETRIPVQPDDAPVTDGWVSPEVQAAQAGKTVEMGKDLPTNAELKKINNQA